MDKDILKQYIDACKLIEETKEEIKELEKKKSPAILGKVKGSNPEFPYQACSFTVSGMEYGYEDEKQLQKRKEVLEERSKKAKAVKLEVEEWLNTVPMRMQRIIKYKIFEGRSWEETAVKISRKATGEGIRKEYNRFFEEK